MSRYIRLKIDESDSQTLLEERRCVDGEAIIREGDMADAMYLLTSGGVRSPRMSIRTYRPSIDGHTDCVLNRK